MNEFDSLMAEDFDVAVKEGKFRTELPTILDSIRNWVNQWCYDHFDEDEYDESSVDADTEDMYKMIIDEATGIVFDEYKPFILNDEVLERYQVYMETLNETSHQFVEVQNTQLFVKDELFYVTFDVMTDDLSHAEEALHFFTRYVEKYSNFCVGETKITKEDCDGEAFYCVEVFC